MKKKAVALKYNKKLRAPLVVAKGANKIAEHIIELAKKNAIPIYVDENLVELLYKIELNEEIPEDLYEIVAEVLAFIYKLDKK